MTTLHDKEVIAADYVVFLKSDITLTTQTCYLETLAWLALTVFGEFQPARPSAPAGVCFQNSQAYIL